MICIRFINRTEFESHSWRGTLDTTLCDKAFQWLAAGSWFSLVSSTNKIYHHDIPEILLKVPFNTIVLNITHQMLSDYPFVFYLITMYILFVYLFEYLLNKLLTNLFYKIKNITDVQNVLYVNYLYKKLKKSPTCQWVTHYWPSQIKYPSPW